jgi:hypothetical protein
MRAKRAGRKTAFKATGPATGHKQKMRQRDCRTAAPARGVQAERSTAERNFKRIWAANDLAIVRGINQSKDRNSSTVISAARISARKVPAASSLCCGTERFARASGLLSTTWLPTCPMICQPALEKALTASLPEILARRAMRAENASNGDDHWSAAGSHRPDCFLILGPEPSGYGFLDVFQRLFFVASLRDTTGQCGTLGYDPAILGRFQRNMKNHWGSPRFYLGKGACQAIPFTIITDGDTSGSHSYIVAATSMWANVFHSGFSGTGSFWFR